MPPPFSFPTHQIPIASLNGIFDVLSWPPVAAICMCLDLIEFSGPGLFLVQFLVPPDASVPRIEEFKVGGELLRVRID